LVVGEPLGRLDLLGAVDGLVERRVEQAERRRQPVATDPVEVVARGHALGDVGLDGRVPDIGEVSERLVEDLARLPGLGPVGDRVRSDPGHESTTGFPVRADSYAPVMTATDRRFVSRSTRTSSRPSSAARMLRYWRRGAPEVGGAHA